jgi:hypothetical protein
MTNFARLEELAKEYAQLKIQKEDNEQAKRKQKLEALALNIIDNFSKQNFQFPLEAHVISSNGKTTYIYKNNSTFKNLFEFLSDVLHVPIPILVGSAKFGPGEIIVNVQDKKASLRELNNCISELRKMLLAKKSQISSQFM